MSTEVIMSNNSVSNDSPLKRELKTILADAIGISEDKLTEETSLFNDLGLDSLAILGIVSIIENEYQIELDEDQLDLMDNLNTAYKYIDHLLIQKS